MLLLSSAAGIELHEVLISGLIDVYFLVKTVLPMIVTSELMHVCNYIHIIYVLVIYVQLCKLTCGYMILLQIQVTAILTLLSVQLLEVCFVQQVL